MKFQFFPLDITYKEINGKAVVYIFGTTKDGRQVCIKDENFEPYFYAIPEKDCKDQLKDVAVDDYFVTKIEEVKKKYIEKDVKAYKVFTSLPKAVPVLSRAMRDME